MRNSLPIEELEPVLARRAVRAHGARDGALVGDGERRVAEFGRTFDEFLRVRGAAQEAEVGEAVQLGVAHLSHAPVARQPNTPCRNQPPAVRRSRKIHSRTPAGVRAT